MIWLSTAIGRDIADHSIAIVPWSNLREDLLVAMVVLRQLAEQPVEALAEQQVVEVVVGR